MCGDTTLTFTNRQTLLADRAANALRSYRRASREAHEAFLEAGTALAEARDGAMRGQWAMILDRVGVEERTARRMIRLARSGVKADTVTAYGGVRGTLEFFSICERDLTTWPPDANPNGDRWHLSRAEFAAMNAATEWLPIIGQAMNEASENGGTDPR